MKACTQYNDYRGTAAADISDYGSLSDYLRKKGVDTERYEPVGVELYTGYSNHISYRFICVDKESRERTAVKIGFESNGSFEEFFNLFKRFDVILTWAKGSNEFADWELDDNTIMIDDRK